MPTTPAAVKDSLTAATTLLAAIRANVAAHATENQGWHATAGAVA